MHVPASLLIVALLGIANCSKDESDGDDKTGTPSTGAVGEIADTSKEGFVVFLKEATYRLWTTKQVAPIDSGGAHGGKTQTYFNDTAATAAKAGLASFPKGSVLVKDLFESDGVTTKGHAVMAKIEDGVGGATWVWYEGFLPDFADPYYGKGLETCTGCHASGSDFVRTIVP